MYSKKLGQRIIWPIVVLYLLQTYFFSNEIFFAISIALVGYTFIRNKLVIKPLDIPGIGLYLFLLLFISCIGMIKYVLLSTNYVRDTVCIAFCCNELISILENAGLMGIELPTGLKNAIDLLQHKAGVDEKTDENKEDDDNNGNSET